MAEKANKLVPLRPVSAWKEMLKRDATERASIVETLEVMCDADLMVAFRQGVQELHAGKGRPLEDIKKDLGL